MESTTLIIGASGQIGIELTMALRQQHGAQAVIASDIRPTTDTELLQGPYEVLDVLDKEALSACIEKYKPNVWGDDNVCTYEVVVYWYQL